LRVLPLRAFPLFSDSEACHADTQAAPSHSFYNSLSLNFILNYFYFKMKIYLSLLLCFGLVAEVLGAHDGKSFWLEWITKRGVAPYNPQGTAYPVYRNVKSYGAKGMDIILSLI